MREAAADLEFETAARLRDEIKRLRETELAIADDPLARQVEVEDRAGAFAGERKYGPKARGVTPSRRRGTATPAAAASQPDLSTSRIARAYQPVQPTHAQSPSCPPAACANPISRRWARRAIARCRHGTIRRGPRASIRAKRREHGVSRSKRPHKPTYDEMGPHAERGLPGPGRPLPTKQAEAEQTGGRAMPGIDAGADRAEEAPARPAAQNRSARRVGGA